ncbi:choice-of-anchor I family protein [Massilia yuzhufengensis]|uniref:40-residue YVTN family beta-propeller repeat-containing protein n=1 Tax=Massilia yuzhufengensis TaxID=1164594 RepID=A0A1I1I0S8_9BURK|nr:choice-of-anchor I family protein [Massilia yuzhufengensis]SFC29917.1 40-residue YVTN family beta-propeller repeat-containing protein [Massilia yuzhufengensis]
MPFLDSAAPPTTLRTLGAALLAAAVLTACGGSDDEPTPRTLTMEKIGSYNGGKPGAAEITAYDAASKRLFVVNGANGTVDVLDLSTPSSPKLAGTISVAALGAGVNSVAIHDGLVALAIEASPKTSPGTIAFYNAGDLKLVNSVKVGAQPDMLTFTPDGRSVLVANEGEPNSYGLADSIDPEGSVSVITVNRGGTPTVASADFRAFNGQEAALRAQGIRIYGPGASAAQDFEPEYIALSEDGRTAYVTLQENNAVAIVDVATAKVTSIKPLGTKNHNLAGMGLDASDEDGVVNSNTGTPAVKIGPQPVKGMYLPDAIARFTVDGTAYLITANEGDARADWPGFNEETRVRAHCTAGLDPTVFGDAANLILDSNLGRLRITANPNGGSAGKNAAGQCNELYTFGARSFSIWDTNLVRVYDSGDEFEKNTQALPNGRFNASNDNNTLDSRSPAKGPEPEGVVVGRFGNKTYAFIGLERVGGVMVYDVSKPSAASFVTYLNTRSNDSGDLGPEGLALIPADKSPNNKPLLIVGNEVSGTTAILQINLGY